MSLEEIWRGDYLNRSADAKFLINYLLARNASAVAAGEQGISININAPWGAGKTFFLTRLAEELRNDGYRVALIDAWRDDHADDPIFAVMSAILKALGKAGKKGRFVEALKNNAGKIAIRTAKGLATRAASFVISQKAVDGIADEITDSLAHATDETIGAYADIALKEFEDGQRAMEHFRKELKKEIAGGKPLFVLVDELDRCRPTYAISLLERVKHLFDVPNTVFIVATHTHQLAHTVRAVYGSGFDAERYLFRFFERTYSFDEPTPVEFVRNRWGALGIDSERLLSFRDWSHVEAVASISKEMGLSLRDIDHCLVILQSVIDVTDTRIHFPVLFAFPIIAAYHLGKTGAYETIFSRPTVDNGEFEKTFTHSALASFSSINEWGQPQPGEEKVNLWNIMTPFRSMLHNGIQEVNRPSSRVGRYVEEFRQWEFATIHQNSYGRPPVSSVLNNLPSAIRKAGRLGK